MRKIEIEWDEDSIEHIGAHYVEPEEVEEVVQGRYFFQKGARGTHYALCQSLNPLKKNENFGIAITPLKSWMKTNGKL